MFQSGFRQTGEDWDSIKDDIDRVLKLGDLSLERIANAHTRRSTALATFPRHHAATATPQWKKHPLFPYPHIHAQNVPLFQQRRLSHQLMLEYSPPPPSPPLNSATRVIPKAGTKGQTVSDIRLITDL
eukprot:GHVO01041184.1.p1 GENE.GHVO01041184.1~~GHVO01041184.1.p1  ORF type:complete len:136 (+),score=17.66 GHVO01041184.1:26-409(+)